ncbi:MAG: metal-binding protein [Hyphomicrobiales bacterium]|nr:MAG: metal-binding protein [Hyphomicrobiales bacterium]
MTRHEPGASPVSFPVHVARLPGKGMEVAIEADAGQRAALAAAHGLRAVERFVATLSVAPWKKGGVRVSGRVEAAVVQDCVVTLEPVAGTVDEAVSAVFLPEGSKLAVPARSAEGEILLDAEGDDAPELFCGDTVDVGQLAEEFFALGIDPYPRRPGASVDGDGGADEKRGPLHDKLAALRKKL